MGRELGEGKESTVFSVNPHSLLLLCASSALLSQDAYRLDEAWEREQIAAGVSVVLLRNHGVLVVGETVARAWSDLYFFERAAMVQVLAGHSGGRPAPMAAAVAEQVAAQIEADVVEAEATWAAVRRRLDRELPGYTD